MKRIIEIEEGDLERIREIVERENKTALSVTTRGTAYIAIADSTPYNPSGECEKCPVKHSEKCDVCITRLRNMQKAPDSLRGDCISREALRNIMKCNLRSWGAQGVLVDEVMRTIDNAPPVETDIEVATKDAYDHGYTDGWKERFGEPDERPQGE